ncbi:MAG TPA: sigma 54-interacting transcriptional regulator [Oculatellaceae cyanobacterium]
MPTILVLSDKANSNGVLLESLERVHHKVMEAFSLEDAVAKASQESIEVLFVNGTVTGKSLQQSVAEVKNAEILNPIPLVVLSAATKTDDVIEVMKLGAFDHLHSPVSSQDLESVVHRAIAKPKTATVEENKGPLEFDFLLGPSSSMRQIEKLIGMAAASNATVLITGETGTGKDTIARAIHKHSVQGKAPLTVVDCTAVPEDYGAFSSLSRGARGTVILDEVGDLNPQMQAMLVRALKEISDESSDSRSGARIIATSQFDLINMVKEKKFREDLYYRLNVLPIHIPPLRERGADILAFTELFLFQAKPQSPKRITSGVAKLMLDYEWPGNLRELQNLIYHLTIVVSSPIIEESDVGMLRHSGSEDQNVESELDYYSAIATLEKRLLIRALKEANGGRAEASRLLGINRQLLYTKMKAHGLEDFS